MLTKVRCILGKLFLSMTAFLWAGCDNGSTDAKEKPFIDVEQELAKIKPTDTTGLRGKSIPEDEYCEMINGWSSHYEAQFHAASIALEKIYEQHKDEPNYRYGYNSCYSNLFDALLTTPEYGVPACPSSLTSCELEDDPYNVYHGVRIDDAYIAELQRNEKIYYETLKSTLEEINEGMKECN